MSSRPKRSAAIAAIKKLRSLNQKNRSQVNEIPTQSKKEGSRKRRAATILDEEDTVSVSFASEKHTARKIAKSRTRAKRIKFQGDQDVGMTEKVHRGLPQPELSVELWDIISRSLPPSQLVLMGQTSQEMAMVVQSLPIWKEIAETARLGLPKSKGPCKTYYGLVLKYSMRICELCYKLSPKRGPLSALPVHVEDYAKEINLCLLCRREYFKTHPEPYTEDLTVSEGDNERPIRITKSSAVSQYKLKEHDLAAAPYLAVENPHYASAAPMRLYSLKVVIDRARRVHGGDIGIEAARVKSESMRQTRINNKERRRQEREWNEALRTETLNNRLNAENLTRRLATTECHIYILSGGDLDNVMQVIRERERRHAELQAALAQRGLQYEDNYISRDYIYNGARSLEQVVADEERRAQTRRDQERRRQELNARLHERGLELRSDSTLCNNYIANGRGNIDKIVTTMKEMQWYFNATNYPTIYVPGGGYGGYYGRRGYGRRARYYDFDSDFSDSDDDFSDFDDDYEEYRIDISARKKQIAQRQFLEARINRGNFATSFENDDERTRPPPSLWQPLRLKMRNIWESYAARTTHTYIDKNATLRQTLIEAFKDGPANLPESVICTAIDAAIQLALHDKGMQYQGGFLNALRELVDEQGFEKYMRERKESFYSHIQKFMNSTNNASSSSSRN